MQDFWQEFQDDLHWQAVILCIAHVGYDSNVFSHERLLAIIKSKFQNISISRIKIEQIDKSIKRITNKATSIIEKMHAKDYFYKPEAAF